MEQTILYKPHDGFNPEWEPKHATEGAAGADIYCAEDTVLEAYKPTLVPSKFDIAVPDGYAALVMMRSGNALKKNFIIPNSPGLVDADYRGHCYGLFTYIPHPDITTRVYQSSMTLYKGDKMAQIVLIKYEKQKWEKADELPATRRGKGGFGSTDASPTKG